MHVTDRNQTGTKHHSSAGMAWHQQPLLKKKKKINPQWHHGFSVCACMSVCSWLWLSLGLGLSAGHWGGSSTMASVIRLANQKPLYIICHWTHLEERFIWTLLSLHSSQESYDQTYILYALWIVGGKKSQKLKLQHAYVPTNVSESIEPMQPQHEYIQNSTLPSTEIH